MDDGWDDDDMDLSDEGWGDDGLDDLVDDVVEDEPPKQKSISPPVASPPLASPAAPPMAADGWEDDNDLALSQGKGGADGWEDDDFADLEDDTLESTVETHELTATHEPVAVDPEQEKLFSSLSAYVDSLSIMVPSLNAILQQDIQAAADLREYYASRPHMRDYTLEKEIPRMDYRVILPDQDILIERQEVASYLSSVPPDHDLLVRAANQSLLADVVASLTAPDLLIRPQHLATSIASNCSFTVDFCSQQVQSLCTMALSIPGKDGSRLNLASLTLQVRFEPQTPELQYQVMHVDVLVKDKSVLRDSAAFLADIDVPMDDPSLQRQHGDSDAVRDAFMVQLSNTKRFIQAGSTGLKGAWKQIDSVANVTSKIDFVKSAIPSLPTEIEDEQQHIPEQARPKSILGGLLSSGLSRLAKTVTVPEEKPPSLYQRPPPETNREVPQLLRKEPMQQRPIQPPAPPPPQESRTIPPPPRSAVEAPPSNPRVPTAAIEPKASAPEWSSQDRTSPEQEEDLDDGWGDEEELTFDEIDEAEPTSGEELVLATVKERPETVPPETPAPSSALSPPTASRPQSSSPKPAVVTQMTPPPPPELPTKTKTESKPLVPERPRQKISLPKPPPGPKEEYPPKPAPLTHYSAEDDIIPTRKRWVHPRLRSQN